MRLGMGALLAACVLSSVSSVLPAAVSLSFEEFTGIPMFSSPPYPANCRVSNQYINNYGVSFTSGSPYIYVLAGGSSQSPDGINVVYGSKPNGDPTFTVPIRGTFSLPSNPAVSAVSNYVSAYVDKWGSPSYTVTLAAYDVDGKLLATTTKPDVGGEFLSVSVSGIHYFELSTTTPDSGGAGFDLVTFNDVTAVPEPTATLAYMVLGGAGLTRRRRLSVAA